MLWVAVCVVVAAPACAAPAGEVEVNVPGKPETWFGTARRENIGHVVDNVDISPDPLATFAAHDGKAGTVEKDGTDTHRRSFTFKTPRAGRYVFAYSTMLNKAAAIAVRYKAGDGWVALPPGRIQPDYFRGWDAREFCYWVDIPAGQKTTRFEIDARATGALIAQPRVDPFEGMGGRRQGSMFALPDVKEFRKSDLGRAVLWPVWKDADPTVPMSERAFEAGKRTAQRYAPMPANYLTCQANAWSVTVDGLNYRMSGDRKHAVVAGAKGRQISTWPTWGYASEWNIDPKRVAGERGKRVMARNHSLETSIVTEIMAIGYDLARDGMDEPDRLAYRAGLDRFAHLMYVRSYLQPGVFYGGGNWGGHFKACLGLSGAALSGESRYAGEWMHRFGVGMKVYADALVDPKGVHRETIRYLSFGFNPLALAALAIERRGGPALFEIGGGRVNRLLKTTIYLTAPNGQDTRDFGDTGGELQVRRHTGMSGGISGMLAAMTNSSRPELARWAIRRGLHRLPGGGQVRLNYARSKIMAALLLRGGAEKAPTEYDDMPLGWHERCPIGYPRDSGYAVMQTGFDSPDDIKMVLKCGHSSGGHGHPCQGTFTLDAYGDYLSQAPGYNLWGRHNTQAYNLLTVDGEGQAADHAWNEGRDSNDGHIERFVHSPVADVCIANNKPAYDGPAFRGRWKNPVQRSLRYVLFVRKPQRRGYFVIVDDMDKDGKAHEYTWNFHTTANHRIVPDGEGGFVARAMTMPEALELWKGRGEPRALYKLIRIKDGEPVSQGWPAPSARYPWVEEAKTDLRLVVAWPREFTHKVTFKVPRWKNAKRYYMIPDHLAVTQKAPHGLFFTVLYPERKDKGIRMPAMQRIAADGLWGAKLGADTILFTRRDGVWKHDGVETDARLVYLRRDRGGDVTGWAVAEATTLKVAGRKLFESPRKVTAAGPPETTDDGGEWRATAARRGMGD